LLVSVPRSAALPRRIAQGVFFVNPNGDDKTNDNDNALLSTNTLVNLEITHAVVTRGSDPGLSWGMKALFVGPQDPLSKVVAWMRAVRRLGAHIIVGDFAAAAGYLVVELGLTPRTAWLRIARGIPPVGDLVLARLCVLAVVYNTKEKENRNGSGDGAALKTSGRERTGDGYRGLGSAPRSCRRERFRTRAESGLKHVLVNIVPLT
jgi:hypothetical protein